MREDFCHVLTDRQVQSLMFVMLGVFLYFGLEVRQVVINGPRPYILIDILVAVDFFFNLQIREYPLSVGISDTFSICSADGCPSHIACPVPNVGWSVWRSTMIYDINPTTTFHMTRSSLSLASSAFRYLPSSISKISRFPRGVNFCSKVRRVRGFRATPGTWDRVEQ